MMEDVPGFIMNLAAALKGDASDSEQVAELSESLDQFEKISMDIKKNDEDVTIKLKVEKIKPPKDDDADEKERPKYKKLKKDMKKTFKAIGDCLDEKRLPEEDLVGQFFDQSERMTAYPDKGEEFYEEYTPGLSGGEWP